MGRTAVAVRALPDSGLVMGLTRGRAWIPVLGLLLAGIVALNVMSLSLGASSGKVEQQIIGLEQEASALRAQLADRLSSDRVQAEASRLGMVVPAPGDITYLGAGDRATALAGQRLAQGFGPADSLAASETTTTTSPTTLAETPTAVAPDPAATPPATTTPTAASDPASVESTAPAAPTGAPAPSTSAAAAAGSGGISPG